MPRKKKPDEPVQENILESPLEEILADRFARYSKYIIQDRALPDARDGLKPVQRRILYAMNEAGNTYNRPYHKSAKTVGNVIGNYHPHGDSSVYDAMVRMSQEWKISFPLIDMQGNNGSIDDDPAAAMRYTECRLSHIADYLLEDIEKKTVEWTPNFSDEKLEPTVFPARYPNLLTQGISGIAAGYATNIPPHNLSEVIEAAIYRIEHPDCSLDELMTIVKGPDFPTGAMVMGHEGIEQAFKTGKGKVFVRARCEVVPGRTIDQIIITEIPYEVVKSSLVKRISDLSENAAMASVLDVRDESDRNGLRIVLDLKKDAPAGEILNYLYKNSDLQTSCSYNMVAIVNQTPVLLSLDQALDAFIAHREDVVLRRSQFDLDQKQARLHILEGLMMAVSVMDEIIALIRASKDKGDSKQKIQARFGFDDVQAEAIVTMRLYRLSNTDIVQLEKEKAQLEKEVKSLQAILKSQKRMHALLIKELKEVEAAFPAQRRTLILEKSAVVQVDETAMIPEEEVMTAVSRDGYVKRVSLRSYKSSPDVLSGRKESDQIIAQGPASTKDLLLVFTDRGKYASLPVYQIPEARWKDLGTHLSSLLKLEPSEKIVAACLTKEFYKSLQLVLASARGYVKRIHFDELQTSRPGRTISVMKVDPADEMIAVLPVSGKQMQLIAASRQGYASQYPVGEIPVSSLKSRGVKGLNLAKGDQLAAIAVADHPKAQLLIWDDNRIKRLSQTEVPQISRPGKGSRLFKAAKNAPAQIQGMQMTTASSMLPFAGLQERKASTIPLTNAAGRWQQEEETLLLVPGLEKLGPGSWDPKDGQLEQLSILEDDHE